MVSCMKGKKNAKLAKNECLKKDNQLEALICCLFDKVRKYKSFTLDECLAPTPSPCER